MKNTGHVFNELQNVETTLELGWRNLFGNFHLEDRIDMGGYQVDGTSVWPYSVAKFSISGVELAGSAVSIFIICAYFISGCS